jgi:hypothetical protein
MRQYRFEIVGRPFERFTWRLVELRGRRRRVLARSDQDYSSLEKVQAAIVEFKDIVATTDQVVDTTAPGEEPFPLPPTRFEFVPGVVPLVVEEFPDEEDDEFSEGPPEFARQKPERPEPERPEPARQAQPEPPEQPAEPARRSRQRVGAGAAATQKRRGGGRRRKET